MHLDTWLCCAPWLARGSNLQWGKDSQAIPSPRENYTDKACRGDSDKETNPRGIPKAPFIDKVEDYVSSSADVEPTLRSFQEMIS